MDEKRKINNGTKAPDPIIKDIDVMWTGKQICDKYLKHRDIDYKQKKNNVYSRYKPTIYFEDGDVGTEPKDKVFCKKRIIFPFEKTLRDFEEILRSNLRGNAIKDRKLMLHYVEGMFTVWCSPKI